MRIARILNEKQSRDTTRLTGRTDTVPDIYDSLPRKAIWLMVGGIDPSDEGLPGSDGELHHGCPALPVLIPQETCAIEEPFGLFSRLPF